MNQIEIGKLIAYLRNQKKMTQSQLALNLNVTDKAISRWETGKGLPDMSFLTPLSEFFHLSVQDLLMGKELYLKKRKKKQLIYVFYVFLALSTLLFFFARTITPVGIFLFFLFLFYLLFHFYRQTNKKWLWIPFLILLTFFGYTYFTDHGATRLSILLTGHPIKAYTTSIIKEERSEDARYYSPTDKIIGTSGQMGLFACRTYGVVILCYYYGYG